MTTPPPNPSSPASPAPGRPAPSARSQQPEVVTGVQLMQGIGVAEPMGFWEDAWSQVCKRPGAVLGMAWVGVVAFFAVFAPLLAGGHPLVFTRQEMVEVGGEQVERSVTSLPLFEFMSPGELVMLILVPAGVVAMLLPLRVKRSARLRGLLMAGLHVALSLIVFAVASRLLPVSGWLGSVAIGVGGAVLSACAVACLPLLGRWHHGLVLNLAVVPVLALGFAVGGTGGTENFTVYDEAVAAGKADAGSVRYTLIPRSPSQQQLRLANAPPLTLAADKFLSDAAAQRRQAQAATDDFDRERLERLAGSLESLSTSQQAQQQFLLGTNAKGQDVAAHLMHACRLSISIGLVSTSIAVLIGVTIGALMGYFGGWVDLVLGRVVEIFMSIPTLFLLIVAAAVLPQNIYVMMIVIGCVTWTGAARFTRAEFLKLRNQDFVQAAKSAGLPLSSILFKHMLPNGVTAVLVDATFAIAAAIQIEAVLSFLALSPPDQPSWGRLLSDATSGGTFQWWLAFFPGMAIFLTVLAYNLIGEALRDAIDPKLKKARV